MPFLCFILLSLFSALPVMACHLQTQAGPAKGTAFGDQALALISRYIEPVELMPPTGVKVGGCIYRVTLAEAGGQTQVSLHGPWFSGVGLSRQTGPAGWTKALLAALMLGQKSASRRERICADYGDELAQVCMPIEADLVVLDEQGRPLVDGAQVRSGERFFLEVRPLMDLYTRIYSRDSSGKFFQVFPNPALSKVTNPLKAGLSLSLPSQGRMLNFDQHPGQEHFYFVFSSTPIEGLQLESKVEDLGRKIESHGQARWVTKRRYAGLGTFVVHWAFEHR